MIGGPPRTPEHTKISRDHVVRVLKDKGLENTEARSLFLQWLDQEEKMVAIENSSQATLKHNIAIAEVYRDAGLVGAAIAAIEAFLDAAEQAFQEQDDNVAATLQREAERLRTNNGN